MTSAQERAELVVWVCGCDVYLTSRKQCADCGKVPDRVPVIPKSEAEALLSEARGPEAGKTEAEKAVHWFLRAKEVVGQLAEAEARYEALEGRQKELIESATAMVAVWNHPDSKNDVDYEGIVRRFEAALRAFTNQPPEKP